MPPHDDVDANHTAGNNDSVDTNDTNDTNDSKENTENTNDTNEENTVNSVDNTTANSVDNTNTTVNSVDNTNTTANSIDSNTSVWQAVFSPQYNAYYFYNTATQETTWQNPLLPSSSSETTTETTTLSPHSTLESAAIAAGIDPALAHLDPSLLASIPGQSTSTAGLPPSFTAKFNARTGQFARPDARDPSHLSEHARAQRMSEFYFDVAQWEEQLAQQGGSIMAEEEGKKRKRPTKKDLDRFKEQKKQKKLAKTAWLRT